MAFAGLWEGFRWTDGTVTRSFCIITTDANAEMAELHGRMPVILERGDWPARLGETEGDPASLLPGRWSGASAARGTMARS
jgi:putative SOS response-associated peptidase YedK